MKIKTVHHATFQRLPATAGSFHVAKDDSGLVHVKAISIDHLSLFDIRVVTCIEAISGFVVIDW